ncbi:high-affinity iron permease [Orbilia ellipsospora]|uniref:High-affinity iron permease n=1 Tax=Orbilia ellipsospora TaxID=2528407 RepID=A0AAV9XEK7_9PEZI
MVNVFAVPVFFIVFRESLETAIIASILLSFLKQTFDTPDSDRSAYVRLRRHVWLGLITGFIIVLAIGGGMIGAFYRLGVNAWANTEDLWEGIFCMIASVIITIMGAAILRVSKLQAKWQKKITLALQAKRSETTFGQKLEKYSLFILPFITILREGLEAVIFVGGVGLSYPASAFPVPVITGILAGAAIGFILYKGGNAFHLQIFLIVSTGFLYLVAAGLFSRGVWLIENYKYVKLVGGDVGETGVGAGSYDIRNSVWHVNCCSPEYNGGGGWGIFNALFGWQNSATYGSVISYNIYWIVVIAYFLFMYFREKKEFDASTRSDSDLEAENGKGVVGAGKVPGHTGVEVDEKSN